VVAVPVLGNGAPAAESVLLNVPLEAPSPPVKVAVVPLNPPVRAPPASCRYRSSVKAVFKLRVPLVVIGPPLSPVPLLMLVTVPPELGDALVSVIVPPSATVPPPDSPDPAVTVTELLASIALVTPLEGMATVPVPVPGNVWLAAKVRIPLLLTEIPVSDMFPVTP